MANTPTVTFTLFSTLAAVLISSAVSHNIITTPTATVDDTALIEKWLETLNPAENEKLTILHFYLQDVVKADNKTVKTVYSVSGPVIQNSATFFGQVYVLDHLLTAGQEYNSEQLGRAQGLHIFSDLKVPAIGMCWNFLFNDGSTISILGRQDVKAKQIVLPIVGGTGKYLMARGIALRNVLKRDLNTLNGLQEYTMYILSFNPAVSPV